MSDEFGKIRKGVPMPDGCAHLRSAIYDEMEVGDSIQVKSNAHQTAQKISIVRMPKKFVGRVVAGKHFIWRVE